MYIIREFIESEQYRKHLGKHPYMAPSTIYIYLKFENCFELQTKYKINLLALIKLKLKSLGCQLFGYAWKSIFDDLTSQILSELFVKC